MRLSQNNLIERNSVFGWIALATCLALLVPLIGMQLTNEVNWDSLDFLVMGTLIYGSGSLFVFVARRICRRHLVVLASIIAVAFLYIWAELAVGVFTSLGS